MIEVVLMGHVLHQESRLVMSWIVWKKIRANEKWLLWKIEIMQYPGNFRFKLIYAWSAVDNQMWTEVVDHERKWFHILSPLPWENVKINLDGVPKERNRVCVLTVGSQRGEKPDPCHSSLSSRTPTVTLPLALSTLPSTSPSHFGHLFFREAFSRVQQGWWGRKAWTVHSLF